ncbi:hypothetical protein K491DRAFT_717942 [Lophiostoma macrostomum CBS 122681]|uniref:Uncharacterized protein n=1 Tax=Lophiostoma macrostomum CBS 122681 TaxID=1314788 RepID=A0A6A6T409_9PLEO|nr:hypothetical protein K491DRAFT_717942 [Lophiostoma macrostomum CBS 122681]
MAPLKRKRSMDLSPLSTSSYTASTPEAQSPTPLPNNHLAMDMDISPRFNMSQAQEVRNGWGMSSGRTRKRFRDNRPDESVVHENTLHKLYEAQRNPPATFQAAAPSTAIFLAHPTYGCGCHVPSAPKPKQKSTLHSFWNLPAPPVQPAPAQNQPLQMIPRCSDCDRQLISQTEAMNDDLDIDMDIGGNGEDTSAFSCADCGKNVCGACAVVSNARHCLQCATTGSRSGRWW